MNFGAEDFTPADGSPTAATFEDLDGVTEDGSLRTPLERSNSFAFFPASRTPCRKTSDASGSAQKRVES